MTKKPVRLRCWNCKHIFKPRKRKRKYRCSICGIRETNRKRFLRWTESSLDRLIDIILKEYGDVKEVGLKYRNLGDIPPEFISIYLYGRRKISPEENIEWIRQEGYSLEDAQRIVDLLNENFPSKYEIPESEPPPPSEFKYCYYSYWCNDPKKNLGDDIHYCNNKDREFCQKKAKGKREEKPSSGIIEDFHRWHKEFKKQHPFQDLEDFVVSQWLIDKGIEKLLADRWSKILLKKYKP